MRSMKKRLLSICLTLCMALTLLPITARAATTDVSTEAELTAAVTAATAGDTIQLVAGITLTGRVNISQDLTLDLNGKTLTGPGSEYAFYIFNGAELTITDSSTGGKITSDNFTTIFLDNAGSGVGSVTVSGGTVENTSSGNAIYNAAAGSVTVSGGTVKNTLIGDAIYNAAAGSVTISGGTVEATFGNKKAIYNSSTGTVAVSGGTVKNSNDSGGIAIYN